MSLIVFYLFFFLSAELLSSVSTSWLLYYLKWNKEMNGSVLRFLHSRAELNPLVQLFYISCFVTNGSSFLLKSPEVNKSYPFAVVISISVQHALGWCIQFFTMQFIAHPEEFLKY